MGLEAGVYREAGKVIEEGRLQEAPTRTDLKLLRSLEQPTMIRLASLGCCHQYPAYPEFSPEFARCYFAAEVPSCALESD